MMKKSIVFITLTLLISLEVNAGSIYWGDNWNVMLWSAGLIDSDGDGLNDDVDPDDDNDGTLDVNDAFPLDPSETLDTDADGIGNNTDGDDDNDGLPDIWELHFGLNSLVADANQDADNDGVSNLDEYNNNTSPIDQADANQNIRWGDDWNVLVWTAIPIDSDGDGLVDKFDTDDDNDGTLDVNDAFPNDSAESQDTDGDGIGNNADDDDDNDGLPDAWELQYGLDPLMANATEDSDGDGISDLDEYTNGTDPGIYDYSGAVPGVTPGEFSVDASGGANYQVPIAVPPGTAGMQPSLTLSYNSRSGNGVLGVGWTLGGLSVITRCPTSKVIDGFIDGIDFDSNDRFCIDGQRLISINGIYGEDLTEYRTEVDGFTKVISYDTDATNTSPEYFKAWTKSGQILEYGNDTNGNSRIEAQGKTDVRLWVVNKIEDTVGNYLTVSYTEDSSNGEYQPNRIDYTGNDNASPSLAPNTSVQFSYETRTDITPMYFANSLVKNTKRLTNITTYTGSTLVRDYQLTYDNNGAANSSRLTQLKECDGQVTQACFTPTTFSWQDGGDGTFGPVSYTLEPGSGFATLTPSLSDVNGDGMVDILATIMNTAGWQTYVKQTNGNIPELITNVTTSLSTQTAITYTPITDSSVYTKGTGATYPEVDIQGAVYVVSKVTVDDGIGGTRDTDYNYTGAKTSVDGRGFLGFKTMSATDVSTGIKTTTTYKQTHPYIGLVERTEQRLSDNTLLGEVDTTFAQTQTHTGVEVTGTHPGVLFPYAATVTKKDYELD